MLANIRTFLVAVRSGSFAAAARQLDLSPALVGRRIQALEDHFKTRLIERTTRTQHLTAAGEAFLPRAEHLLDTLAELEERTRGERADLEGRIRLSAPTTLGVTKLAPIIARFQAANPEVTVELSLSDRRVDLISEGFDCAVRIGELATSNLIARRVGTYRFAVCASPDWVEANGHPRHPDELAHARCILNLNMRPRNKWQFLGPEGEKTVEVSGGLEIDNGEAQRAAALAGAGLVYLPLELVGADIAQGRLVQVLPDWQTLILPVYLMRPSRQMTPMRVTAVLDALADGLPG